MKISDELQKLGLSPKAARVYLAIIELGKASSIDISKRTKIKRTTVYDIIIDLLNRGYVTETKKGKRRLFISEDPKKLIDRLEQSLFRAKKLVPVLHSLHVQNRPRPHIRFYDGISGVKTITEEIASMEGKEQLWWTSISDVVELLGRDYLRRWIKRRIKRGISGRVLRTPETQKTLSDPLFSETKGYFREIKYLPVDFVFEGALCIFDDKVSYISSRNDSFGFIIESPSFAKMLRLVFESVWIITPDRSK